MLRFHLLVALDLPDRRRSDGASGGDWSGRAKPSLEPLDSSDKYAESDGDGDGPHCDDKPHMTSTVQGTGAF